MKTAVKVLSTAIVLSLLISTALMAGDFSPIYEGVEYAYREKASPRLMKAYALRIDLCNPAVSFLATPGNGGLPLETNLQTTPNFMYSYGLKAAINANYFSTSGAYSDVQGLLISNGSYVSYDQYERNAQLRIAANNWASITGDGGNPIGYWTAVAGCEYNLINGVPLGDNVGVHPRTAVGLTKDLRFLIWCVVDGRQPGWSDGATILDMAYWMLDFGCWNAICLDGGGSSCMVRGDVGVVNRPSDGAPRAVGANLGVNTSAKVSKMDVFVHGSDHNIWYNSWTSTGGWTGFMNVGAPPGGAASDPSAVSWGPGHIDLFVRANDGTVRHRWCDGYTWSPAWDSQGGNIVGSPDACSWNVGRLDVFARSPSNTLVHCFYDAGGWSGWEDLGGTITSDPAAVSWGPGRIDVFARGSSGQLLHKFFIQGIGWYGWENLGNFNLVGGPDACAWDKNRLDVFWRTTDNSIRHIWYDGGWQGPDNLGVTLTSDPGCVSREPGIVEFFARGTDAQLWHRWYEGAGWSNWGCLGGVVIGGPDACSWSNDAGTHQ